MLAAHFREQEGLDSLQVSDIDRPTVDTNEVLVAVEYASVHPIDLRVLRGEFSVPLPSILGGDLAGVVEEVGAGVEEFEPGDRVYGTPLSLDPKGTFAEYAAVPAERLAHLPDEISFDIAAATVSVGSTAYQSLIELGNLSVGETCLIHGGSGGVGHASVQLAAASGATVIATAGSDRAIEYVREFGADAVFDYDSNSLVDDIQQAAPDGVDVILDHMLDTYLPLDVAVVATGGRIVVIQGDIPETPGRPLRHKGISIIGRSGEQWTNRRPFLETKLCSLISNGQIEPHIQDIFSLSDIIEAQRTMADERVIGKLLIQP